MDDLAGDLQRFLEDRPILARPATLPERLAKWSRRHPAAVVSAMGALVLPSVVLSASTVMLWREREARREVQSGKMLEVDSRGAEPRLAGDRFGLERVTNHGASAASGKP